MSTHTITLQGSPRRSAPRLAQPIGEAVASFANWLFASLRSHQESPARSAARLRALAQKYSSQPSFAADLRAAADRHCPEYQD